MMTEFYQEDYRIRSVRIGEQSSLPGLEGLANVQQNTKAVLDEDDEIFLGYGFRSNVFPYRPQDVYTREQTERCYRSIVLENEFLRARFLPELGGRLISLTDKASGRDLLYQNKTLYAGNLAMRNSWFSGGVEWNASIIGHNPFTCSPLFAARTQLADGTPVLRMYEYERLRGVSFQMDFFLPDGSRVLFARMRLVNENAQTVPTYWWSNIAVPEWRGGRVVVPADAAYVARDGVIFKDSVPVDRGGDDVTYPVNNPKAVDHFWKIAPEDASVLKFALRVLLEARQYGEALRLIAAAPPELQRLPRVRLSEAQALVGLERREEAEAILLQDGGLIVPDIREGEQTMSEVWLALQQKKYGLGREAAEKIAPVPYRMDFRMN